MPWISPVLGLMVTLGPNGCVPLNPGAYPTNPILLAGGGFVITGGLAGQENASQNSYESESVSGWIWDFGDETTTMDVSNLQNPQWKYNTAGNKPARFIVQSTKGCIDTVLKNVIVYDKPPITLPFEDTLICSIDTLQLRALGQGNFSWRPGYNIINPVLCPVGFDAKNC